MGEIVSAVATSHILMSQQGAEGPAQRVLAGMLRIGRHVRQSQPDVIVVISNDHMFNVGPEVTARFLVGCAERYVPFGEMDIPREEYRGAPDFAHSFIEHCARKDFAVAALQSLRPDHGTAIPLMLTNPDRNAAVVPLFVNYDLAELPTPAQCADLGVLLREFIISSRPAGERIAIVAAGGLSHWVGYESAPINEEFDRRFLQAMERGQLAPWYERAAESIRHEAGNGGLEVMSWLLMAAAVPGAHAQVVYYEPMPSWMTGMGGVVMS
jgi:2'-aminobiphenyl-2,3-diol 1,2-dioxygenase large subunit